MIRMWKIVGVMLVTVCSPLFAQDRFARPVKEPGSRSYAIHCTFVQAGFEPDSSGRPILKNTTVTLPEVATLEDAKAEYTSETKYQDQLYLRVIQARVSRVSEMKVRVEMALEVVWSEGAVDRPTTHRKSLQCTRLVTLGSKLKLTLQERDDKKGEGITAEVVVREVPEE